MLGKIGTEDVVNPLIIADNLSNFLGQRIVALKSMIDTIHV